MNVDTTGLIYNTFEPQAGLKSDWNIKNNDLFDGFANGSIKKTHFLLITSNYRCSLKPNLEFVQFHTETESG